MMVDSPEPIEVFYSYAQRDEALRSELEKHLGVLKRRHLVSGWHHRNIQIGTDWMQAVNVHLNSARVILLLISADFMDSDYCYSVEMRRALERHEQGMARVIPILLRSVDLVETHIASLRALPINGKPITSWSNRDTAFADVAKGIREVIQELNAGSARKDRDLTSDVDSYQYSLHRETYSPVIPTHLLFQAGGALPAGHITYIERSADRKSLYAASSGEYLHLIAPRQMGKTSLLKHLISKLHKQGWRCAYIDLSVFMGLSKSEWYASLGKTLSQSLTPGASLALNNQIDLRSYLIEEALPYSHGRPLVALIFDEVEGASKVGTSDSTSFSDTFFMTLRNLYIQRDDYKGTIIVALAGAVNPDSLVKDPGISPFNVGTEIELEDFSLAETQQLTKHLHALALPVDEAVHQEIYRWTSGHPYLTQYICSTLERLVRSDKLITEITAQKVTSLIQDLFLNNTSRLNSNLGHAAKNLARLSSPAADLWSQLRAGNPLLANSIPASLYSELYLSGLVKRQNDYLVIRNKIYEYTL